MGSTLHLGVYSRQSCFQYDISGLPSLELKGIPPEKKGVPRTEVMVEHDYNMKLRV